MYEWEYRRVNAGGCEYMSAYTSVGTDGCEHLSTDECENMPVLAAQLANLLSPGSDLFPCE